MDIKNIFQSKIFKGILIGIGIMIAILFIFQIGTFVGYRKAAFSYQFGENYYKAFRGPGSDFPKQMIGGDLPDSHGAVGKIIQINLPRLVIEGIDKVEKNVLIKDDTTVRKFKDDIKSSDLKVGDFVTIIGSPNSDSEIEAKLIRVLPAPESFDDNNHPQPK